MNFLLVLLLVLAAAAVRVALLPERTADRIGRTFLRFLVVGYCGLPMLVVSLGLLLAPEETAARFGFTAGHAFQEFLGVAYLGMSLTAVLAVRAGDGFLTAAALPWIVFLGGATFVHIHDAGGASGLGHGSLLHVVVVHGGVALLLAVALLLTRARRGEATAA